MAEVQADQIADQVMRMPESIAANDGAAAIPTEPELHSRTVHAKHMSGAGSEPIHGDLGSRINARRGKGSALDSNTRSFFEPRLKGSLERVRLHTDGEAVALSRVLSAKAFTIGNDIFFGAGQYQPNTKSGKSLLAHELVHVGQGGTAIRLCKDKSDEAKYDAIITEIKALDAYANLEPGPKATADTIIKEGKEKPDCLYYAQKLKILFTTPVESTAAVATKIRQETATAVKAEEERLGTEEAKKTLGVEEAATADVEPEPVAKPGPEAKPEAKPAEVKKSARNWTSYPTRFGGGIYKVDATDPLKIYVKVKVNLIPGGEGTWDDVKKIKSLEDAIEKHAARKGFTLNLEFVNPENKPDFVADAETVTINANPRWPNATNWGSDAQTCAHELFHVLNFPEDRYNYIESHAANKKMEVAERLIWFLKQMHKPQGYDIPESLMASGQYPIEEDVCTIARLDMATCLKAREKLFPPGLNIRLPFTGFIPTVGYANIGGSSGVFLNYGLGLGIPLTLKADWELFIGAHGSFLAQLEGEERMAFLIGGRIGIEKMWTPKEGGFNVGGFAEGGAAFVSDKESATAGRGFLSTGYGYGGLNLGYKLPPSLMNMSFSAEIGGGVTGPLGLHDPTTFIKDEKLLPFFTAGLRATWMF